MSVARGEDVPGTSDSHGGLSNDNIGQRPSVTYMPGAGRIISNGGNAPASRYPRCHGGQSGQYHVRGRRFLGRDANPRQSIFTHFVQISASTCCILYVKTQRTA